MAAPAVAPLDLVGASANGADSDEDGEPRLAIVDEEEEVDPSDGPTGAAVVSIPGARVLKKSVSLDPTVPRMVSVASVPVREEASRSAAASEAIESLLLLGQGPVLSPRMGTERRNSLSCSPVRRYSCSSSGGGDVPGVMDLGSLSGEGDRSRNASGSASYYQRMRERNNEASKRCRLKRRMKAESLENQANLLFMSNKLLKQRIAKLEKLGEVMKEGVKKIQARDCRCMETVDEVRRVNGECSDVQGLSNGALIQNSVSYREQNLEALVGGQMAGGGAATTSSEDEMAVVMTPPTPATPAAAMSAATQNFVISSSTSPPAGVVGGLQGRQEISLAPVVKSAPPPAVSSLVKIEPAAPDPLALEADQSIPMTVLHQMEKQREQERLQEQLRQQQQQQQQRPPPTIFVQAPAPPPPPPKQQQEPPTKTALDVINDTIIKSLKTPLANAAASSNKPVVSPVVITPNPSPLNLVKLVPAVTLTNASQAQRRLSGNSAAPPTPPIVLPRSPSFLPTSPGGFPRQQQQQAPKQIILLSSPVPTSPVACRRKISTSSSLGEGFDGSAVSPAPVIVKCEPEIQIVECDPPPAASPIAAVAPASPAPPPSCIAAAKCSSPCRGEFYNLSKLTSYLDLVTKRPTGDDSGGAAMERAIIKSRLRVHFWKADETISFICDAHRNELVCSAPMTHCALCNKKKSKKPSSPQATMMTITYRMSLENYTTTGNILPIGLLVCGNCKDKHLKGVDFSNSQVYHHPEDGPIHAQKRSSAALGNGHAAAAAGPSPAKNPAVSITAIGGGGKADSASPLPKHQLSIGAASPPKVSITKTSAASDAAENKANGGRMVQDKDAAPKSPTPDNIFARFGRLNDALRAINPRYRPLGFSITSIESCSPSVLEDAVSATETAVSTLMSVIAPGQEAFLWEAIKPKLDAKLGAASKEEEQKQQTTYNWTVPEDASSSSSNGTSDEGKKKNKKTGTNNTVND